MAEIYNTKCWKASGKTGGTQSDLDGKGQSASEVIEVNNTAEVYESDVKYEYLCRSSGATADGLSIVGPVQAALDNAGDQNLRWHLQEVYGASAGEALTFCQSHTSWADGLSSEEIFRIELGTGETIELDRISFPLKGGGTEAAASLEVYDLSNTAQLGSITAGSANSGSPIATSSLGATVLVRVSNTSGAVVVAAPNINLTRK